MTRAKQQQLPLTAPARPAAAAPALSTQLGASPELGSPADMAEAVRCIAWLDSRRQTVETERDVAINRLREEAARELHVVLAGERLTFDEWRGRLVAAVEAYVAGHKAEVFTGETQTVRFAAGEVSYKRRAPAVALADGIRPADIVERLKKRKGLAPAIEKLLEKTGVAGWLRIKFDLDLQQIQRRFKDGQLRKRDLPTGLIVTEEGQDVIIKPSATPDRADSAAA